MNGDLGIGRGFLEFEVLGWWDLVEGGFRFFLLFVLGGGGYIFFGGRR